MYPDSPDLKLSNRPVRTRMPGGVAGAPPIMEAPYADAVLVCRRCAHRLLPHVRQGFLRPNSVRWRNTHDHPT